MLAPEYDQPKSRGTMLRWAKEAGLTDIHIQVGGNGLELRARKPAVADVAPMPSNKTGRTEITAALQGWAAAGVALAIAFTQA
jgi:hypothetical protein